MNLISEWSVQTKSKLPFPVRMKAALAPAGLSRHIGFNFDPRMSAVVQM